MRVTYEILEKVKKVKGSASAMDGNKQTRSCVPFTFCWRIACNAWGIILEHYIGPLIFKIHGEREREMFLQGIIELSASRQT